MKDEDKNELETTPSPSEEKVEENIDPLEKDEDAPKDIDHKKELEGLKIKDSRTRQEQTAYNLKKNAERAKELGLDPAEVLGLKSDEEKTKGQGEVTKQDLAIMEARLEAKNLTSSPEELEHIMWYVENRGLSVEEAHLLANKGKVKTAISEMRRADVTSSKGSDSSGRKNVSKPPELPKDVQSVLARRGFKLNEKGEWEAKFNKVIWNGKEYVTVKK
jgi:hypothetical protein